MRLIVRVMLLACLIAVPAFAQQAPPGDPETKRVLTPEEIAEKEGRKACKVALCGIFRGKQAQGPDVACTILKTWREEDIEDMLTGGKLEWPWGRAKCETKLALSRALLVKAVTEPKFEMAVPKHDVVCELDRKSEGKVYKVSVAMAPKIAFENGKAVSGAMNWGDVDAPALALGAIWPAVKLDNGVNVLGSQLVKLTNEFLTKKCDEVKDELPK